MYLKQTARSSLAYKVNDNCPTSPMTEIIFSNFSCALIFNSLIRKFKNDQNLNVIFGNLFEFETVIIILSNRSAGYYTIFSW